MKTFIVKCFILSSFAISLYFIAQWNLSRKYVDENYPKFTHSAGSLILGISRAHDGIVPGILEEKLEQFKVDKPFLNFAFQLSQSPYGPVYFEAIKKKLNENVQHGIFILSVSGGSICIPSYINDSPEEFSDNYSILAKMDNFNNDPNFEYIRKSFGKALYKEFIEPDLGMRKIYDNGWVGVDLQAEGLNITQKVVDRWKVETIQSYRDHREFYKLSKVRYQSLDQTIGFLKQHGTVFLVRIPVDKDILDIENQYLPDFDLIIERLASKNNVPYLNYGNSDVEFEFYDGAHLSKDGAILFTKILSKDITEHLSGKNNSNETEHDVNDTQSDECKMRGSICTAENRKL